jgi:aminopeptidase N
MTLPTALVMASLAFPLAAWAQAPLGIPRELALQRAALVSNLRYALHYTLTPHAPTTQGTETLTFDLRRADAPLLLDFRDGVVQSLVINGSRVPAQTSHGHLILPATNLRAGANQLQLEFAANVAPAEKAITRFEDRDDGSEYLYTLFVPMDAEMAFPCFDQPDLKARFQLTLTAPAAWTVISNTSPTGTETLEGGQTRTTFAETNPISTYLFAFAAGPFVKVHDTPGLPGLYVRKSKAKEAATEAPAVQHTAADGIRFLSDYFAQPFPFPKYDMVLIPGFAYGGMEHAGATFLREEGVLFRTAPTETTLLNRQVLVLHELTHQWFGDFATMRWFDDLWLKEGFAQYMAYRTLASLRPNDNVWKRFYEAIKPAAYGIDETQGTTPIYQDIPNLQDAKSAYGAIVYSKAPGVIKQLAYVLGEDNFRNGLRLYVAQHPYSNAEWSDLIAAFEKTSGRPLGPWAEMWIKHRGMPQVDVAWSCSHGMLDKLTLSQHAVLGGDDLWPIATELLIADAAGNTNLQRVTLAARSADIDVPNFVEQPCPAYVFANNDDHAYGLFLLDAKSRTYVTEHIGSTPDLFRRTLLWGSLWDGVRAAEFDPATYVRLALHNLPAERDESLAAGIIGRSSAALHRYIVSPAEQAALTAELEALAADRMENDSSKDLRITWFRALPGLATRPAGRQKLKALLDGSLTVPGVQLRQQDRWQLVTALLAYSDPDAGAVLAAEQKRDPTGDGQKYAWIAQAARPDAATKKQYFEEYLHNPQRSEDWIEGSLGAFNYWNQSALTAPYLRPSLEALAQIKQTRKIFFLVGWLNAFIGGQQSPEAQQQVQAYLRSATLDKDLRLKILQAEDELDRTVAIRKKYSTR